MRIQLELAEIVLMATTVRCPYAEHRRWCEACSGRGWVAMGMILVFDGTSIKVRDAFL